MLSHSRTTSVSALKLAIIAAGLSCATPTSPTGSTRLSPLLAYSRWWAEMQQCSGVQGDLSRIQWYEVSGNSFRCRIGECAALWIPPHAIYVASDFVGNRTVVAHEMLHELLRTGEHPNPPFSKGCSVTWADQ